MQASATTDARISASEDPEQLAYSIPHAARLLDMGVRKVWALVHAGEIDSIKIGSARRVTRKALIDYLSRLERAA